MPVMILVLDYVVQNPLRFGGLVNGGWLCVLLHLGPEAF